MTDVARRFRLQLESLLRSDESERLRERVVKGAAYFAEQCGRVVAPLIEASYVETDSKETRKALRFTRKSYLSRPDSVGRFSFCSSRQAT